MPYYHVKPKQEIEMRGQKIVVDALHENAEFWGLYKRDKAFGVDEHIRDFDIRANANIARRILEKDPSLLNKVMNVGFEHTTFNVIFNQQLRTATIIDSDRGDWYVVVPFFDPDEWSTIHTPSGNLYDVHFLKDEDGISICFYIVYGGEADTSESGQANSNLILI